MLAECIFSFQRGFVARVSVGEKLDLDEKTFKRLLRAGFIKPFSGTVPYTGAAIRPVETTTLPPYELAVVMPPIRRTRKKKEIIS